MFKNYQHLRVIAGYFVNKLTVHCIWLGREQEYEVLIHEYECHMNRPDFCLRNSFHSHH